MRNNFYLAKRHISLMFRQKGVVRILGVSLLMTLLALTTWQCREDDFTGEVVGVCPEVITTNPLDGAIDVATNQLITATFNQAMDPTTVNETTFLLKDGLSSVEGIVTLNGATTTFTPNDLLQDDVLYTATIKRASTNLMGIIMVKDTTWQFKTAAIPIVIVQYTASLSSNPSEGGTALGGGLFDAGSSVTVSATANPGYLFDNWTESGQQVSLDNDYTFILNSDMTLVANFTPVVANPLGVDLGSAGDFVVLAGTGVSNIGVSTQLSGDVGSFPSSTINGLLSSNVNGTLYMVADPVVGLAKTDLTTAYNDAQGRSTNAISLSGQLGGLTLAPGLYVNSSTSGISGTGANGILTLDAGGDPNAVWVFKMGSTLVTDEGTSIVLAGGAQAKNIYWSVGTSATLGTNSIFVGNILADQSITLTTGASLTGRALARIGAVTLDTNIISKP